MCVFRELFCKRNMSWDLWEELPAWSKWGTFLSQKRKKKSPVVSGSQILCKMSWDGDHLDKDIPTPPNKMQVRKQEKHTPTHRAEPRHRMIEGRRLRTMQEEVGLHRHLGMQSPWEPWECSAQRPRREKGHRSCWMWGYRRLTGQRGKKREDRKWRNFHFHSHFPCFLQALKSCPN